MSDLGVEQVLAQMRVMAAQANQTSPAEAVSAPNGASFSQLLSESIEGVNSMQQESSALKAAFETGDPNVDLPEVMVAVQKASVSFQAVTEVRNKLLTAYQEVMNMQL